MAETTPLCFSGGCKGPNQAGFLSCGVTTPLQNSYVLLSSEWLTLILIFCRQWFGDKRGRQPLLKPECLKCFGGCLLPCQPQYCTLITELGRLKWINIWADPVGFFVCFFRATNHLWACLMGLNRNLCIMVNLTELNLVHSLVPSSSVVEGLSVICFFLISGFFFNPSCPDLSPTDVCFPDALPSCFLPLCGCYHRSHPCKHPLAAKTTGSGNQSVFADIMIWSWTK